MASLRNNSVDADDIVRRYLAGESVNKLADRFGVSRQVIYCRLRHANVHIRNRSESMFTRMEQTSPEERKRLTEAANKAKRGKANTPEMLAKRARAQKRFIGKFEQEFIDALDNAKIPVFPQEPFLSYNLDIGCGNVAMEIHTQTAGPLTAKFIKKLVECVHSGKNMVYVWISPRNPVVLDACYENVVALIKSVRANPPATAQYWVIRSTGETYASGSFDFA